MEHIAYLKNHFLSINNCEQRYDHTKQFFNAVVVFLIFSFYYQMWKICIPTDRQQVIRTCLKGIWNIEIQKNFSLSSKFQKEKNLKRKKEITKNMWMVCVFLPNFLTFGFRSPFTFQFLTLELLMKTCLFKIHILLHVYHVNVRKKKFWN